VTFTLCDASLSSNTIFTVYNCQSPVTEAKSYRINIYKQVANVNDFVLIQFTPEGIKSPQFIFVSFHKIMIFESYYLSNYVHSSHSQNKLNGWNLCLSRQIFANLKKSHIFFLNIEWMVKNHIPFNIIMASNISTL
jgi:hypothetical protein